MTTVVTGVPAQAVASSAPTDAPTHKPPLAPPVATTKPGCSAGISTQSVGLSPSASMWAVAVEQLPTNATRLVVLDDFTNRTDRLNSGDLRPDVTHGRFVADRAERVTGLRAERIEVASLKGGPQLSKLTAALRDLHAEAPGGDLRGTVVVMSLAADHRSSEVEAALRQVVKDGAKVYVGAGNDFANQMCIDGVVCVGATDRVIGHGAPSDGKPASSLVQNPRTTAWAPGGVAVRPVVGENGEVAFDVDGDMKADYGQRDLQPVAEYTEPIVGQPLGSALLTGPELRSVAAAMKRDGMTPTLSVQLTGRIVNFAEVARLEPSAAKAFTPAIVPQGADPPRLFMSAEGALRHAVGLSQTQRPGIVFFVADAERNVRLLGDKAPVFWDAATSWATPNLPAPVRTLPPLGPIPPGEGTGLFAPQ